MNRDEKIQEAIELHKERMALERSIFGQRIFEIFNEGADKDLEVRR